MRCTGRLIAGCPLMLNGGVNAATRPARRMGAVGCSGLFSNSVSNGGGSASVGVSNRSQPVDPPLLQRPLRRKAFEFGTEHGPLFRVCGDELSETSQQGDAARQGCRAQAVPAL